MPNARLLIVLAIANVGAVLGDFVINSNWPAEYDIKLPFIQVILICDAALVSLGVALRFRFSWQSFFLSLLGGLRAISIILWTMRFQAPNFVPGGKNVTATLQGQTILMTMLTFPLFVLLFWRLGRGGRCNWEWLFFAALFLATIANAWFIKGVYITTEPA
jgi:hypothetical protein